MEDISIWVKIVSVAMTAFGALNIFMLKWLREDIKDQGEKIDTFKNEMHGKLNSIDQRLSRMEGENDLSKSVMLSLVGRKTEDKK
jgi:hypothetical protein